MTARKLVLLHPDDNVLVCTAPIVAGEIFAPEGAELRVVQAIEVGHKIARCALLPGGKIVKYGAPIGSATTTIAPGEWVHSHNMQSDYIPSHSRNTATEGDIR